MENAQRRARRRIMPSDALEFLSSVLEADLAAAAARGQNPVATGGCGESPAAARSVGAGRVLIIEDVTSLLLCWTSGKREL
ncbi:MAG: hypothetical protein A2Y76_07410 [Planctomycetes bacterium RBG_13_60_9]|nr:MAG: hypothetical protein A2Y76_07410 [Planctomycetes bacterium RBG_13_60_9]